MGAKNSGHVPVPLQARDPLELRRLIAKFQMEQGGKCPIASIYWDGKQHVCWIYPLSGIGGSGF